MRFLMVFVAALACASPAAAQHQGTDEASVEAISAEMVSYGQWLVSANEIQAPVMNALSAIHPTWQAALANRDSAAAAAAFRPFIAETIEVIRQANDRLDALETPRFTALALPADLQTQTLLRQMRQLNEQIRLLIESYHPLLDAMIREDMEAVRQAGRQMHAGLELIFESQILFMRGGLAATPREESTWEMQNVQLLYFLAGARILDAWPENLVSRDDRTLAPDLREFASQIEASAAEGSIKLESELAVLGEDLAAADRDGDAANAAIFRRAMAVLEVDRAVFPMARELAAILRDHSARFEDGRITLDGINGVFLDLQRIRRQIDTIVTEEAAALSRSS